MSAADTLATGAVALLIEAAVGYPDALFRRIGHPVTWIGSALARLDARLNRDGDPPARRRRLGVVTLLIILAVTAGLAGALAYDLAAFLPRIAAILGGGALASSCLAQRSLHAHVAAVADALDTGGLDAGRRAVSMIVGRDTATLDASGVGRATVESLAENFADGVVAPALYIALGGLTGGLLYKAVNTADSMVGHRTERHGAFGWASARLDDVVNWPAARLAALALIGAAALSGASPREAWRIMRRDARGHASPNAGWPEAAMAGALGLRLGGARSYGGRTVEDTAMGDGTPKVDVAAIRRALRLYRTACTLQLAVVLGAAGLAALA